MHSCSSFSSLVSRDVKEILFDSKRSPVTEEKRATFRVSSVYTSPAWSSGKRISRIACTALPGENTRPETERDFEKLGAGDDGAETALREKLEAGLGVIFGANVHSACSSSSLFTLAASICASVFALRWARRSATSVGLEGVPLVRSVFRVWVAKDSFDSVIELRSLCSLMGVRLKFSLAAPWPAIDLNASCTKSTRSASHSFGHQFFPYANAVLPLSNSSPMTFDSASDASD